MILLYHAVIPDHSPRERVCIGQALLKSEFERQMMWLSSHYSIVSLAEYTANQKSRHSRRVAVTFDDGTATTFDCISSFVAERKIPMTIFISTGHLEDGELLWFSYLKAICFEDQYPRVTVAGVTFELSSIGLRKNAWYGLSRLAKSSGNPVEFCKHMAENYPLAPHLHRIYAGMTFAQVRQAGENPFFEIGAHTVTHPYLPQLSLEGRKYEISSSKDTLATLSGKSVRFFAYPGGAYDQATLDLVKAAGYEAAFAVFSQGLGEPVYELGRVGVYSPSLWKLQLKLMGVSDLVFRLTGKAG